MFPEIVAARVGAGARYLVNLANDTWLGDPKYGDMVFDIVSPATAMACRSFSRSCLRFSSRLSCSMKVLVCRQDTWMGQAFILEGFA